MTGTAARMLAVLDGSEVAPFTLTLTVEATGAVKTYDCLELLRVLPGRRQVIRARADGEPVVLKLFTGAGQARYLERERSGLGWLADAQIPVPEVLDEVSAEGVSGLVLRYLPAAFPVDAHDQPGVETVAGLLARMHERGVRHDDLHLDNFLLSNGRLFAIDGDGVRKQNQPIALAAGLENLAVLAAQRPPSEDHGAQALLDAYLRGRPDPSAGVPADRFVGLLHAARQARLRRYLEKTQRSCSEYQVRRRWRVHTYVVRGQGEAPLAELQADPDAVFATGTLLKAGNSATIARTVDPDPRVVKRFNIKGFSHGVRRMLRRIPRFRRAWICGQLLNFLEIPTARPLALLEQRFGPWRGVAYLVMEQLDGPDLASEVAGSGLSDARCEEVTRLFCLLKTAGLSHGDTKASNFLIHDGRVHLVDLDAMRLDLSGFDRDLARFLANWPAPEKGRFEASFRSAGLL